MESGRDNVPSNPIKKQKKNHSSESSKPTLKSSHKEIKIKEHISSPMINNILPPSNPNLVISN